MTASGSVPAGTRVGRYQIESLIREGGMGEVYAAHDSNLGRRVALKILPRHRTSDPERVARFVREARASSALNHPSIVAVHDAGNEGDVHFLAMELIDGQPLSAWQRKRRSVAARVELMAQVAEGLARAHDAGIVHRDLKPDNIMVTHDGRAKIVDFGVAKLTERLGERSALTGATTPTSRVGTTAYMAPEQVEGKSLDHRADVFAFGVVLYELLAGTNPFAAPQYADTIHNVAHLDPPLEPIPHALRRIVRRCLRKEPEQRYDSLRDAALDLREALGEGDAPRPKRRWWRWLAAAAALPLLAAAAWLGWSQFAPKSEPPRSMTMTRLTNNGQVATAAVSPDGNYLVHVVREGDLETLYVKQIASGTITRIAEPMSRFHFSLQISADGNYAYYAAAERSEPNVVNIYQVPILGGTPRLIAADTEFWFSLSPDGTHVAFRRFNALEREHKLTVANVDGSGEEVVLRRGHPSIVNAPVWSPDGHSITYVAGNATQRNSTELYRLSLRTRESTKLPTPRFSGVGSYAWLPDGSGMLLTAFDREQPAQVWFIPAGETTGRKVTNEVSAYFDVRPTADARTFSAVREQFDSNIYAVDFNAPSAASAKALTSGVGNWVGAAGVRWVGNEVIFHGQEKGTSTFFAVDANGGTPRRLIRGMAAWQPAVSPDEKQIAFASDRSGSSQIWIAGADGASPRQVTHGPRADHPSFHPDGRSLVYLSDGESQYAWRVPIDGSEPPVQLTHVPTSRVSVSPDGQWLLCRVRSREPNVPLWRTAVMPIAPNGGGEPRYFDVPRAGATPRFQWHPDGKSFLFIDGAGGTANIWQQDLDGSAPRQRTFFDSGEIHSFDLSRDGKRLVVTRGQSQRDAVLIRDFR
ncbi:MAG TPA: LpqB family beta-propeller domain-containing protein [Thermoanaerobaculia bacterium]|nr:LpqB family beta-propeller domain-containing protein [Thermoanaerobaculia bacterium]